MKTKTFCGWTPIQIARHYDFPLERTGKGQKAAIISLGGKINEDDLAEAEESTGDDPEKKTDPAPGG